MCNVKGLIVVATPLIYLVLWATVTALISIGSSSSSQLFIVKKKAAKLSCLPIHF